MSEKAEKKPDSAPAPAGGDKKDGEKKGGGLLGKLPVLLGIVMVIEAVVLFAGFKFLGAGAKPAAGAEISTESPEGAKSEGKSETEGGDKGKETLDPKKAVVIKVTEFKAPNKKNGASFLYDLKICLVTRADYQAQVEKAITDKEPLIQDRIRTIIAQSDPDKISGGEPGLETLRRQIKYQLDGIIGDGIVNEVLVPRCTPFRTDY